MPSQEINNLKTRYKNGEDKIGRDLIGPCLKECKLYRRGTGTFTSSALKAYVGAIDHLLKDDVKVQILCSPKIDTQLIRILQDIVTPVQRLKKIRELTDQIPLTALGYTINSSNPDYQGKLLSYLISKGIIEIKFAIPTEYIEGDIKNTEINIEELETRNMYHVKFGYFVFPDESIVAFDGSANESDSALHHNTERVFVFKSWEESQLNLLKITKEDLDEDWEERNSYIKVFPISDEALKLIKEMAPSKRPKPPKAEPKINTNEPLAIDSNLLRSYQANALTEWKGNGYHGILAMATGTGKTKTAIEALSRFIKNTQNGLVIITVPYQELARQWVKELGLLDFATVSVFEAQENWANRVLNIIQSHIEMGGHDNKLPILVCVNKSFRDDRFQNLLKKTHNRSGYRMLIVDECHHFNKEEYIKYLPISFNYRLGLSATPYEKEETRHLDKYFGDIVYEFKLKEAIEQGYLTQYSYHPILIEFTEIEANKYLETIKKLTNNIEIDKYNELDRILETMVGKLTKLEEILKKIDIKEFSLFYCGEGYVELEDGERIRQIDSLTRLLTSLNWRVGSITSNEIPIQRKGILDNLKNRNIDAIASMRILDEGIDIPECRQAFILASQRSERQGIQRRGRVLRKSSGKDLARLYDFILVGPKLTNQELDKLYNREIKRAQMFTEDAINKEECLTILRGI